MTPLASNEYRDVPREAELFDGTHELDRLLLEYLPHSDIVLVSRPHNMATFLDRISFLERISMIGNCRDFQLIYDAEAIFAERDRLFSHIRGVRVPPSVSAASSAREISLARAAQVVTVVSEHEREVMLKAGIQKVRVLAHAIEPKPGRNAFSGRCNFLFVGAMDILENPNADSIRYFCSQVWPQVRAATGAQLVIAGCGTTEALSDLKADGVKLAGLQADLTPLYDAARVFVVPTRYAAGIPHKAHEAAAHGLPMVVSTLIGNQLGWVNRQDCLVAGTPDEFAAACVELHNNADLWSCLRNNSLERIRSELNRQRFADAIRGVIAEVREEKHSVTASTH
jgi:glycosyltransferase involved in cell wall biosynthesis